MDRTRATNTKIPALHIAQLKSNNDWAPTLSDRIIPDLPVDSTRLTNNNNSETKVAFHSITAPIPLTPWQKYSA